MYAPFYIVCTELPSTCHPERRQSRSRTFGSDTRAWSGQKREASADAGSRNESCWLTSVELHSFWQTKMQMNAEKIAAIARRSLPFGAGFASLITLRVSRLRKTSTPAMPPLRMTRMIFVECEQHIKSANIAFLPCSHFFILLSLNYFR